MEIKTDFTVGYIGKRMAWKLTLWKAQPDSGKKYEGWLITAVPAAFLSHTAYCEGLAMAGKHT